MSMQLRWVIGLPLCLLAMTAAAGDPPDAAMGDLSQYGVPAVAGEVELARSAAPEGIAADAEVLTLGKEGYVTAVHGKNGFVCLVERSWATDLGDAGFWNPRMRGPLCYNPPSARSVLPYTFKRTELALAGRSRAEIKAAIGDAMAKHTLPALEAGGMTYMMSKEGYLNDKARNWVPHLMFYFAGTSGADWGADLPGAPPMLNDQMLAPEGISVIMVPVTHWSDGTPAPKMR